VNIPIQNIYYLLCYAWDKLEEKEVIDVDPIESTSLADLFARVLISGTKHLVKRGFDRGYVAEHEWTGRLRGRILFQEAIRMNRMKSGRLPCLFDDLSYDVLHNQILKATMRRLIRSETVAGESSEGLAQLCRLFSEIRDIELTNRLFGQVQLYRNNQFYDFLLKGL
jgi:5-methylcytosine-specific restriction enzyme subunit McrC